MGAGCRGNLGCRHDNRARSAAQAALEEFPPEEFQRLLRVMLEAPFRIVWYASWPGWAAVRQVGESRGAATRAGAAV